MYCPNCNAPCGEGDHYCAFCGCVLQNVPKPRKGTHIVPILILVLLSVIGTVVFFVTRSTAPDTQIGDSTTDMPWFQVYEGYVFFDESLYTGASEITIPSEINGKTVYGLGEGCFENCTWITTVILPNTLEEINSYAFSGCTSLRGIYLPDSVYLIGSEAFAGCSALEAIRIPSSVQFIDSGSFEGCFKLNHVFYGGSYGEWVPLYEEFIGKQTMIHCTDGSYSHSAFPFAP